MKTTEHDWRTHVQRQLSFIRERYAYVFVAGLSAGALLALERVHGRQCGWGRRVLAHLRLRWLEYPVVQRHSAIGHERGATLAPAMDIPS